MVKNVWVVLTVPNIVSCSVLMNLILHLSEKRWVYILIEEKTAIINLGI